MCPGQSESSPLSAVNDIIQRHQQFRKDYASKSLLHSYPNDMIYIAFEVNSYLLPLKKFYDFWRLRLSEFTSNQYLSQEKYQTLERYNELIKEMKEHPDYKEFVLEYYPAVKKVFQYFSDLVFEPDYSCLVRANTSIAQSYDFDTFFRSRKR